VPHSQVDHEEDGVCQPTNNCYKDKRALVYGQLVRSNSMMRKLLHISYLRNQIAKAVLEVVLH
jgi:hypothetical protein